MEISDSIIKERFGEKSIYETMTEVDRAREELQRNKFLRKIVIRDNNIWNDDDLLRALKELKIKINGGIGTGSYMVAEDTEVFKETFDELVQERMDIKALEAIDRIIEEFKKE
nr:MAG TPA: hypothetical protein [Caudoviricetes sp.]